MLASNDTFRCEMEGIGSCSSPHRCEDALPKVWNLSFRVHFSGVANYLRIPLDTLAVNDPVQKLCTLQVFRVDYRHDNQQIIFGAMLLQSLHLNATEESAKL